MMSEAPSPARAPRRPAAAFRDAAARWLRDNGVLLLLVVFTALSSSSFLTSSNLQGIALDITILTVVAIGDSHWFGSAAST